MQKAHRLRLKKDISFVLKMGRVINDRFFSLKYADSKKKSFRFTVVVSSKISKKAVQRNKIRRQVKEIVRGYQANILPVDFLIFAKKNIIGAKYEEIKKEVIFLLNNLLNKINKPNHA